ncbi:MAG: hypothetical protein CL816_01485 [Coxiellaceae bacterium]|nr:hypothetical protein [Coxiellaceae bacterium]
MKYIKFETITIKNFLSVGDSPVVVNFDTGINVITGINKDKDDRRNGVGKSTIADAVYFTIFGNTLRDIKKENVPNNVTTGQTETCIEFTVTENKHSTKYSIVRLLNPSKCYIYKDGIDKTRDSISNTSKYISDLLCSTPDVFQNCIIMTLNNTIPFMAQKKMDKRKFIEGILNLQVFGDMLQLVKGEYNEAVKDLEVGCTKYEGTSKQIESYNAQKSKQDETIHEQIEKLKSRKGHNTTEIKNLKNRSKLNITKTVSEYQDKIDSCNENITLCRAKYTDIVSSISKYKTENEHLAKTFAKIGTGEQICSACLRPLADHDKQYMKDEQQNLQNLIKQNVEIIDDLKLKLDKVENIRSQLTSTINSCESKINKQKADIKEKDNLLKRVNQLEALNADIVNDIKEVDDNRVSFDSIIDESVSQLNEIQQSIDIHKNNINKLDVVKFVVSEEGVRSYIVKKILQLLNGKLAYYLKKMDANCMCVFNEYFEEQIIDEKGKICSYHNFSGAERKNIDLACLFAFMDIRRLQGDVAYNFSIYDELLDSSLDERGIDLVLDILNERVEKYDECVMVISHRKESVKFATNEVITLEKSNGVTTRVAPELLTSK